MSYTQICKALAKHSTIKKVTDKQKFYKTGKGQYGEGDVFIGATVSECRLVAQRYKDIALSEVKKLLKSRIHEERLVALLLLVGKFQKGDEKIQKEVFETYITHTQYINNWDLVDISVYKIVGAYAFSKSKTLLSKWARSENLWERRMAIVATFYFIQQDVFDTTFEIAEILLNDTHDLIHKAVGWMLREVGKRNQRAEEDFLKSHYHRMPRTMLRYAIERFPEAKRQRYLQGKI